MTVALDTGGADDARPFVERANPTHPSLVDAAHLLDVHLGVVNVPAAIPVDEQGILVRPPEAAWPWRPPMLDRELPDDMPAAVRDRLELAKRIPVDHEPYLAGLRDWVTNGAASSFALDRDEVVARSRPRDRDASQAAASFELGQHLFRAGATDDAVAWFREAHRLQPDNWTYKRQAWHLHDPSQTPNDVYEGDWYSDVSAIGPENYYRPAER